MSKKMQRVDEPLAANLEFASLPSRSRLDMGQEIVSVKADGLHRIQRTQGSVDEGSTRDFSPSTLRIWKVHVLKRDLQISLVRISPTQRASATEVPPLAHQSPGS